MPKYRKLHTKIVESEDFNEMPDDFTRLFWALLPLGLSREGTAPANPALMRSKLFPLRRDVTEKMIETALTWFASRGMIRFYQAAGRTYLFQTNFAKYQGQTTKEAPSDYPPPPADLQTNSGVTPELVERKSGTDSIFNIQYSVVDADAPAASPKSGDAPNPPPPQKAQAQTKPGQDATEAENAVWQAWVNARGQMGLSANDWPDLEAWCREFGPEWVEHAILDADASRNGGVISRNFVKAVLERYRASGQQYPWLIPKGTPTKAAQDAADVEEVRKYLLMQVDMGAMTRETANERLRAKLPGAKPI